MVEGLISRAIDQEAVEVRVHACILPVRATLLLWCKHEQDLDGLAHLCLPVLLSFTLLRQAELERPITVRGIK